MLALLVLGTASLVASGVLFRHSRLSTYVAAAGLLCEAQWLVLALLHRTLLTAISSQVFYSSGAAVLLLLWAVQFRHFRWPRLTRSSIVADGAVVVTILFLVVGLALVLRVNGFTEEGYVLHGFYHGDTATFTALTERSLDETGLVRQNPFSGNGPLEYPTLLHAAWADFFTSIGSSDSWQHLLEAVVLVMLLLTVPAFFLVWDTVFPEPTEGWKRWFGVPSRSVVYALQGGIVLYVAALAWDGYVYPQSHFFLLGLFLLLAALLARLAHERGIGQVPGVITTAALATVLLFSNAVTGTAAVAIVAVLHLFRATDRTRARLERAIFLLTVLVWPLALVLVAPGNAAWGLPDFSYTAALDMVRLAPPVLLLLAGYALARDRQPFVVGAGAILLGLAFVTFFFSQREIVVENASRFFYHGLLATFPLLIVPLVRGWYWVRRELFLTSRSVFERMAGLLAVAAAMLFLLLPAGSSVAGNTDRLLFKNEARVSAAEFAALDWVATTPPDTVFLADPDGPWTIPAFTGRAMLRTNYWLSADDTTHADVVAAFNGDGAAQERVRERADFLYLREADVASWDFSDRVPAFVNEEIAIYAIR